MGDWDRNDGVIAELLPNAGVEELREFVLGYSRQDAEFSVTLGQWLMGKYARQVHKAEMFVEEVRKLFRLTDDFPSSSYRSRYDDFVLDWCAISDGMEKLVATLQDKLSDGVHEVVVPPVLEFYRLFLEHYDDFEMVDEANINAAATACDDLLLKWAEHPTVPNYKKKAVYQSLQELAGNEAFEYVDGLTSNFFLNYLTLTQSPEETLKSIEKLTAEGRITEELVHKHISLLRQFGRDADARKVIQRNAFCFSVLDAELERLYQQGEDYAALNLIDHALVSARVSFPYLERKIRFLQRLEDTPKLIDVYRSILLDRGNTLAYYYKLKELVPPSEWAAQYKLIVAEGKLKHCGAEFMARIYAAEQDYPALSQAIMNSYDIPQMLQTYLAQLPEMYHEALLDKGTEALKRMASQATKRSEYASVAARIKEFATLPGAKPITDMLVAAMRTAFSRRPAYLDELAKKGL